VTLPLAGIAKRLDGDGKELCFWGEGVKTNFVDYSAGENFTLSIFIKNFF